MQISKKRVVKRPTCNGSRHTVPIPIRTPARVPSAFLILFFRRRTKIFNAKKANLASSGRFDLLSPPLHWTSRNSSRSDPNICNIFHVCIHRNEMIVDQPFMCPFPTVFKQAASGKMFCARPEPGDCPGKAFYRSADGPNMISMDANDTLNYLLPENTLMMERCEQPGLYSDTLYCNAYHKCTTDGKDEHFLCENQLLFNPESNICDYPINVVCGGRFDRIPTSSIVRCL